MKYMKDITRLWVLGMMVAVGLVSCSDDDNPVVEPTPDVPFSYEILNNDAHSFSFSSAGNVAQVLKFKTTRDWTVELEGDAADYDWLTLFARQGTPNDSSIVIAAAENTEYDARRATFYFKTGDVTEKFGVYQAQKDAVVITDPKAYENLSNEEHVLPIEFALNTGDYKVSISTDAADGAKWINETEAPASADGTRAMVDHTIWVKVNANTSFNIRKATITVSSADLTDVKATMQVYQFGLARPVITINNEDDFTNVTNAGAAIALNLTTENLASVDQLFVDIPSVDKDWLSYAVVDGKLVINVAKNESGSRSTTVAVCVTADPTIRVNLPISQQSASGVTVSISNKDALKETLSKNGGTLSVKYQSFVAQIGDKVEGVNGETLDWIRIVNDKIDGQVLLQYDANTTLRSRTAVIKVYPAGDESHYDRVIVEQDPGTGVYVKGSLQATLQGLVDEGIYAKVQDITSLELHGTLTDADFALLKTMTTSGNGYNLNDLNLYNITNTTMKNQAFMGCLGLKSIVFPKDLEYVPTEVCRGCTNLQSVKISSAEFVHNHAFHTCTNLQYVYLPANLTYLYGCAFEQCKAIKEIHLRSYPVQITSVARSIPQPTTWSEAFMNTNNTMPKTAKLFVPAGYTTYYKDPDPQHVSNRHLQDFLSTLDATSEEWTKGVTQGADYLRSGTSLKTSFTWTNQSTQVQEEDDWNTGE